MLSLGSAGPVLHDLLVFGSFVLEPYFDLEDERAKRLRPILVTLGLQSVMRAFYFKITDQNNDIML